MKELRFVLQTVLYAVRTCERWFRKCAITNLGVFVTRHEFEWTWILLHMHPVQEIRECMYRLPCFQSPCWVVTGHLLTTLPK